MYKQINKLALPAIVAGIAEPLIALADNAIIGHLGTTELGAVGLGTSFYLLVVWILAQTKTAISAIVSKHYGENRLNSLKNLIPLSILVNLCLGLLFLLVTSIFAYQIFSAYSASGELLDQTITYFKIRAFGFPLALITFGCFGIFRGMQNTLWAMKISITGSVLNLILNITLVYGIDGIIPAFGIKGAAYASVMAQCIMVSMAFWYLQTKTPFRVLGKLKFHPQLKNLLGLSSNLFVRTILLNIAYFLSNKLCTIYGTEVIAAHTIAMNIWLFSAFFIDGYAAAGNILSGRLLGAKDYEGLLKLAKKVSLYGMAVGLFLVVIGFLLYTPLGLLFSKEPMVIQRYKEVFWIVALMHPLNAVAFIFDGIFKGLGKMKYLRNVLLISTFVGFVPTLFILDYFDYKLYSIWVAFVVWMLFRAGALIIAFRKQYAPKAAVQ